MLSSSISLLGASMLLESSSPVSLRGHLGQVLQGAAPPPWGEGFPLLSRRSTLEFLLPRRRPPSSGARRGCTRSAPSWGPQARPSARKGEAVPQAPQPPPSCTPPPAGPQPGSLTLQCPAAWPRQLRLPGGRIHPGRAAPSALVGLHRGTAGHRWASRRKVSSEERGGTGRGGAGRREEERLEEGEKGRPLLPYRKPLGRPLTGAAPASINNIVLY